MHWSPALAWAILAGIIIVFVVTFDLHAYLTGGHSMSEQFRVWLFNSTIGPFIFGGWVGVFVGLTFHWFVRISPSGGGLRLIPGIAREMPNVTECFRITGEDCYFIKLWLRSIDDLEPVLDLFTPHGRTTTSIVHSAPVPPRPLPVPVPVDSPVTGGSKISAMTSPRRG